VISDSLINAFFPNSSTSRQLTAAKSPNAVAALDTVNGLLDLTTTPRPVSSVLDSSDSETGKSSLTLLAKLLQQGVVGTETYDINGRPYTRFIETTIGDDRLNDLKQYRSRTLTRLDQRA